MTVRQIYNILDGLFPFDLSAKYIEKFGGFDNSGIIFDSGKAVKGIVWALDLSGGALESAKKNNVNLIITHHPAVFKPVNVFSHSDISLKNFLQAVKGGISIISMHINADIANGGNDQILAELLNPNKIEEINIGGSGRRAEFEPKTVKEIADVYALDCKTDKVRVYGDGQKTVETAAVFAGAGLTDTDIGADVQVFIASEIKHHLLLQILESGKSAIDIPHYAAENFSFKKIYQKAKVNIDKKSFYFEDERLL